MWSFNINALRESLVPCLSCVAPGDLYCERSKHGGEALTAFAGSEGDESPSTRRKKSLEVRMKASYDKVNSKKSKQNGKKPNNHHIGRFTTPPSYSETIMNENGIDDPCYKRPRFLWVPTPVRAPCHASP